MADEKKELETPTTQIATIDDVVDEESKQKNSFDRVNEIGKRSHQKLPYPKAIGFIVTNEFCERFSYYGLRAILVLYLKDKLAYNEDEATVIYHVFSMFVYFFPVFGAMIADSWLGRFTTIFTLSIIYACGNALVSITAIPTLGIPGRELTIVGLLLVAIGTGGIKPCVSAFGGDQFKLPEQAVQLGTFFSLFYFAINCGSLISTFVTPILRVDVKCFDDDDCYPLAFGVPGILMVVSIIIFVAGKPLYIIKKPAGNIIVKVSKTIVHALKRRSKLKKVEKREHWLDYADDVYPKSEISGIKAVLKVLVLFTPVPVFWALFDQQGSRWTFQASRMNGKMGDFILKPDQVQVINPLLILIFIPLFEVAIYPALAWCKIVTKPLHRMVVGGLLASLSFVISAIIELNLEQTYPVLPGAGVGHLRIYNGLDCPFTMVLQNQNNTMIAIPSFDAYQNKDFKVSGWENITFTLNAADNCNISAYNGYITVKEREAMGVFISNIEQDLIVSIFDDISDKRSSGKPGVRILNNYNPDLDINIYRKDTLERTINGTTLQLIELDTATDYTFKIGDKTFLEREMHMGETFAYILSPSLDFKDIEITEANSLHMLLLIPQYVVITMGEVMFSVTGLEFSFTQAPASMKSVLTAGWLLTVAFGNLIVVIIAEVQGFDSQAHEFFLFAGLMLIDIIIFWLMTLRYEYVEHESSEDDQQADEKPEKVGLENLAYEANNTEEN